MLKGTKVSRKVGETSGTPRRGSQGNYGEGEKKEVGGGKSPDRNEKLGESIA